MNIFFQMCMFYFTIVFAIQTKQVWNWTISSLMISEGNCNFSMRIAISKYDCLIKIYLIENIALK